MRRTLRSITTATLAVLLASCGGDRSGVRTDAVLSDGRTDGAAGFFFLPPVAAEPEWRPNVRGLSPVVEVVALDPGATLLATFSGDAVKESGSHYMIHWSTKEHAPAADTTYRIRVLLDGALLGFADAQVARDGRELRLLHSQAVFGLTGSRTVPVKFRISGTDEDGDADDDGVPDEIDVCPTLPDPDQLDSDEDGVGDACECLDVVCEEPEGVCLVAACDPALGCVTATAPDESTCPLQGGGTGLCSAGQCVPAQGSLPSPPAW